MRKQIVVFLMIVSLVIMAGCADQNEGNNNKDDLKPTESAVLSSTQQPLSDENQEESHELAVENEALKAVQVALDWMKSMDSLHYTSYSSSIYHYLNRDNPLTTIEYYDIHDTSGHIQRQPAIAHARNHSVSGTAEMMDEEVIQEIDSNSTFSDYYVSKDHGLYYHYDDIGKWFREDLSDEFRTMEHLEELIELFMQYPDQLVMSRNELEEGDRGVEGVLDEDFYTISLDLSSEQFVDIVPYFNSNFLTGTYDTPQYLDQTFYLISTDLRKHQASLMLDKDYNLVSLDVSYESDQLDGGEGEDFHYSLNVYLFNFNTSDELTIPEDALLNASEKELYLE